MTQSLMNRYMEYSRRKLGGFRHLVEHGNLRLQNFCYFVVALFGLFIIASFSPPYRRQRTKLSCTSTDWTATLDRTLTISRNRI